jgi:alkylation response protein AidB-like acyl-CoA dehydrogenase
MSTYSAPVKDMLFAIQELADLESVANLPGCEEATPDLVNSVLEEAAKFANGIWAPLNRTGDIEGAKWNDGQVVMPDGFRAAYRQFVEAGWNGLRFGAEYGGQSLPKLVDAAVMEMWGGANLGFSLVSLLTQGAIEAILLRGTEAQKQKYLPRMVAGEWTGTMNLTEAQAGSDLALLRTSATREGDHYRIRGQKIFISFGEHDLADNIIHLVLARTPNAPEGVKGISLFVVPKVLVDDDGSLGERNDVCCVSIEHKLGIHASPTATLAFGDKGGAIGYLLGEENRGLESMFIMMNDARFAVGMQGVAIAERAYQQALAWAKDRVQGRDSANGGHAVSIIRHPDVRRMLMSMKSRIEAMRALAYVVAGMLETAHRHSDEGTRAHAQAAAELLIPVVKGWNTESAIDIASIGVQVHGGMGYVEETGAAQHLRDARITTIYEGTTGIQALDLVGRKILRDDGRAMRALIADIERAADSLDHAPGDDLAVIKTRLRAGVGALSAAADWIRAAGKDDINGALCGATPFLHLLGIVSGGWQMARAALIAHNKLAAGENDPAFYQAKIATARFFADHFLSQAAGWSDTAMHGGAGVMALAEEQF